MGWGGGGVPNRPPLPPPKQAGRFGLQRGVPEGGDDDEPVAVPFGRLAELEVERLSGRGDHLAVGEGHLAGEGPVTLVTTVIQSPLPNWIGYGVFTCMSGKLGGTAASPRSALPIRRSALRAR